MKNTPASLAAGQQAQQADAHTASSSKIASAHQAAQAVHVADPMHVKHEVLRQLGAVSTNSASVKAASAKLVEALAVLGPRGVVQAVTEVMTKTANEVGAFTKEGADACARGEAQINELLKRRLSILYTVDSLLARSAKEVGMAREAAVAAGTAADKVEAAVESSSAGPYKELSGLLARGLVSCFKVWR